MSSDGVRRCWECNREGHLSRDCPNLEQHSHSNRSSRPREQEKSRGENTSSRRSSENNFEKGGKRNKKEETQFPLKSAFKNKSKQGGARKSFFDSNGSEFDSDSSSANMIFFVALDLILGAGGQPETAFATMCHAMISANYVGVDSMCNVQILKQLPRNAHNVFATEAGNGVNTAGEGGQMHVASTFSWNLDHDFKHCPVARSNLISTSFITRKMFSSLMKMIAKFVK